jgi:hypothetical protein
VPPVERGDVAAFDFEAFAPDAFAFADFASAGAASIRTGIVFDSTLPPSQGASW